jgi:hypothetical protein
MLPGDMLSDSPVTATVVVCGNPNSGPWMRGNSTNNAGHERRALQQQHGGNPQRALSRQGAVVIVKGDQGGGKPQRCEQHVRAGGHGLRVQETGDDDEKAKASDHDRHRARS